jgi:UDP-N-acetylglucosamine acyltransferase
VAADVRLNLQRAYKILYRSGRSTGAALEQIRAAVEPSPEVEHLCHFIASTKRGIC